MNDKDLRVKRTFKLLSDSLMSLMCEKSFEKISVIDICERAMVHRATFYSHFEDKYALLKFTLSDLEEPFNKDDFTADNFEGYKNYYIEAAKQIVKSVSQNQRIYKAVCLKNKQDSIVIGIRAEITDKIEKKLENCQNSGVELPAPPKIISNFCVGGAMNLVEWWIINDMPIKPQKLIEYITKLIPDF